MPIALSILRVSVNFFLPFFGVDDALSPLASGPARAAFPRGADIVGTE